MFTKILVEINNAKIASVWGFFLMVFIHYFVVKMCFFPLQAIASRLGQPSWQSST